MTKHYYTKGLDIPSDADSARYFIPEGYIARFEDGVLIIEPKESEGEKIRKEIVSFIRDFWVDHRDSVPQTSKWLAWLEKQKDSPMPEDTVIFQKGVEEGRRLEREEQKPEWSEEDEKMVETICKEGDLKPSEQRWLKSLKNRGNSPQSNTNSPSWSEEDEKQIRQIERIVKNAGGSKMLQEKIHNWLKSLRPQPHWKPSEEQMEALDDTIFFDKTVFRKRKLVSLLEDLKKLK